MTLKPAVFHDREKEKYLRKCEAYYDWVSKTFPKANAKVVPLPRVKIIDDFLFFLSFDLFFVFCILFDLIILPLLCHYSTTFYYYCTIVGALGRFNNVSFCLLCFKNCYNNI